MHDRNQLDIRRQEGAVLVTSLLFLLVLTLIGVTAMQTTSLEEKMAGNLRDRNVSFQAAESALRGAETLLRNQSATLVFNCVTTGDSSPGLFLYSCSPAVLGDSFWGAADLRTYSDGTLAGVGSNPLYVVEQLPPVGFSLEAGVAQNSNYYRITARGTGGTTAAVAILQSVYKP